MHAQKVRAMFDKGQKGRAGHWVRMALHVARTRSADAACSSTDMSQGRTWSAPAAQQRTLGKSASSRVTTTRDVFSPRLVGVASSDAPHHFNCLRLQDRANSFFFEFHVVCAQHSNMHKRIEEGCLRDGKFSEANTANTSNQRKSATAPSRLPRCPGPQYKANACASAFYSGPRQGTDPVPTPPSRLWLCGATATRQHWRPTTSPPPRRSWPQQRQNGLRVVP